MSSIEHEALIRMFRQRPALAAELLAAEFGVDVPAYRKASLDGGLNDLVRADDRVDGVVVLAGADGPALAIVVDVQLSKDEGKRRSWPMYLANVHERLDCPAVLLVLCTDQATADWCATPIDIGHPGFVMRPLVLGPDQVRVATDAEQART